MPRRQKDENSFNNQHPADEHFERNTSIDSTSQILLESGDELLVDTHRLARTTIAPTFEHGEKYHEAGKRDVELYIRTYNTLLRSSGEISLKALIQAHYNIDSSLHPDARSPYPDMSAFIYSVLRLPASIIHCDLVLLGQSEEVFLQQVRRRWRSMLPA